MIVNAVAGRASVDATAEPKASKAVRRLEHLQQFLGREFATSAARGHALALTSSRPGENNVPVNILI